MHPSDRTEFLKVLNGLAAMKGKPLAVEALDLWWLSMQKWSLADFKAAAAHLVTSCQFIPTPYDFAQLKKAGELTAGEAWAEAIAYCSGKRKDVPTGRVARAAQTVGGFHAIGMANIETALPHIERRFKEAYSELSSVEETREALPEITFSEVLRLAQTRQHAVHRLQNLSDE